MACARVHGPGVETVEHDEGDDVDTDKEARANEHHEPLMLIAAARAGRPTVHQVHAQDCAGARSEGLEGSATIEEPPWRRPRRQPVGQGNRAPGAGKTPTLGGRWPAVGARWAPVRCGDSVLQPSIISLEASEPDRIP